MNRETLSRIDEDLDSSEVAQLCFLCSETINRKRLEGIEDAKSLFVRLEEKGLLENSSFLTQLLRTIHRADLLNHLQTDASQPQEADANPVLSEYRVMLFNIYEDLTTENLEKLKYLLGSDLGRRQLENSKTALDVFLEMEKMELISKTNVQKLHELLLQLDQQLASTIQIYMQGQRQHPESIVRPPSRVPPHVSMDQQRPNETSLPQQPFLSISESEPSFGRESVYSDAEPLTQSSSLSDETEYYALTHVPRGLCVVLNIEDFLENILKKRNGSQEDAKILEKVFSSFGFKVIIHHNLTADEIRQEINRLSKNNFIDHDALVVCALSHGEMGCIFGSDAKEVRLQELTEPFRSGNAPTLAGKPKLFFIQACQGNEYQRGSLPCPTKSRNEEERNRETALEEDAGSVTGTTVPFDADFLLGMATVPACKSFRNTSRGSIYIQELCKQLERSAKSSEKDDILTVLTRVNREVSKGVFLNYKQMPEPKYTLTKKLVLRYV